MRVITGITIAGAADRMKPASHASQAKTPGGAGRFALGGRASTAFMDKLLVFNGFSNT
jgi:hypothetical protein